MPDVPATLPSALTWAEYQALRAEPARWEPTVEAIAAAHGLGQQAVRAIEDGSNLVAWLGDDRVIKLFPPFLRYQYESERAALRHLRGRVKTPIPELIVDGEVSGWPYLILSKLDGVSLASVWGGCNAAERAEILRALGALIAEVQAIDPGALAALPPAWPEFIEAQMEGCRRRHERVGLPSHLLGQLERYLGATSEVLPAQFPPAILTGEYTPKNLLMSRRAGAWQIAGLIDFGDAMVGFAEYDLLGPSTFLAAGDATCVRALLAGYGWDEPPAGLRDRLMRMLLLHRHSNLDLQVAIAGWQSARTFEDLARLLWPW
jgi:hygromycin-B 7''-O-kinase